MVTGVRPLKVAVVSALETISWDVWPFQFLSIRVKNIVNIYAKPYNKIANNRKYQYHKYKNKCTTFEYFWLSVQCISYPIFYCFG